MVSIKPLIVNYSRLTPLIIAYFQPVCKGNAPYDGRLCVLSNRVRKRRYSCCRLHLLSFLSPAPPAARSEYGLSRRLKNEGIHYPTVIPLFGGEKISESQPYRYSVVRIIKKSRGRAPGFFIHFQDGIDRILILNRFYKPLSYSFLFHEHFLSRAVDSHDINSCLNADCLAADYSCVEHLFTAESVMVSPLSTRPHFSVAPLANSRFSVTEVFPASM